MPEYEAGLLDDLQEGTLRPVDIDGQPILLLRDRDTVYAVGGTCPHAGGPLKQGVSNGDRVVCPWHKATFCARTGAVLEPPAVDPLPSYEVRLENRRIYIFMSTEAGCSTPLPDDTRTFVIVGGGAAGALAAQTLRQEGFGGRLVIFDREGRVPYDRTVLSKYFLSGQQGAEKTPLQSQSFYYEHKIERQHSEVVHVDPQRRRVTCADGTCVTYDKGLLAMGGAPKRLDLPGSDLQNVFVLRARGDADAILAQAERSTTAVILGASFIGMEVAASLRERGLEVTVVGKMSMPFNRQLGPRIGEAFKRLHETRGVNFRLGRKIVALRGSRTVNSVELDGGEIIPTDFVVIGAGIQPATGCVRGVPLNQDGSITVSNTLSVAEDLYAAGDIAHFPLFGSEKSIRVEHWRVAEQQGRVAALNMLGGNVCYDVVPVFWTIQYLKRLDYIGHASDWDDIVVHGDLGKPEFLAYYVKDRTVVAAVGLDRDKDTAALIELFNERHTWTATELGPSPAKILVGR